ncbi:618_t:CDS:2 [Funneliformis geosporum]|uniref:618_t:CDS:1 n=1 Tax=Funneliformis geosporum TaxID=1117311 RepID=A0A9W4SP43_9GLOM|nr:618_t:CDS:2 [Funneliformis geosporum]
MPGGSRSTLEYNNGVEEVEEEVGEIEGVEKGSLRKKKKRRKGRKEENWEGWKKLRRRKEEEEGTAVEEGGMKEGTAVERIEEGTKGGIEVETKRRLGATIARFTLNAHLSCSLSHRLKDKIT